ncbi:MAG: DUF1799 domain-containing protein [Methylobacter sp.]|nr:DUF1799 domain-containing protein [Methylobacter sp.]
MAQAGQAKKLSDAGYFWISNSQSSPTTEALEDDALLLGVILPELPEPPEIEAFEYWHECDEAVRCYMDVHGQWLYSFDGIAGINIQGMMPIIALYQPDEKKRLELFREVKAFASGVLQWINEQREKARK